MRRNRRMMNQINVVPYIDVMLVLLVIFMVTAPMLPQGSVDLPSVAKSNQAPVEALEITIGADDVLTVKDRAANGDAQTVSRATLVDAVRAAQTAHPGQPVLIAGDKNVPYGKVLEVMDDLQKQNLPKIGLLVSKGK